MTRKEGDSVFAPVQDWLVRKAMHAEIKKSGLEEDVVDLPFGRVSFLRSGQAAPSAIPVLMLHGAASDNSLWVRFARHLDAGQPLIIPDLPGHGKSVVGQALSFGIEAQAGYLMQFLEALGVRRAHIIGSSMGGAIALRLAARHPGMAVSLVLIGAMGVHARPSWLEQHIAETGRNPMISVRSRADYLAMMRIGMNKPPFMPGFVVSSLSRAFIRRAAINEKVARDIGADLDQASILAGVSCHVQLIWGSEDRISSVDNGRELHRLLKASQLSVMEGIGHVPMVEAPREAAVLCRAFLSRVPAKAPSEAAAAW